LNKRRIFEKLKDLKTRKFSIFLNLFIREFLNIEPFDLSRNLIDRNLSYHTLQSHNCLIHD
jgi:hypothetical protein